MDNCWRYLSIQFMLQTLLRLLHLVQLIVAYNLVIDTQTKGITSYIRNLRNDYEDQLEKQSIPTISKKRCLGIMELADIKLANVGVESTLTVVVGGDYYLRIEHLHAHLQGIYQHNLLFIYNTGGFQFAIRDLNASLGPLVPVNIGGIPYINQDISCRIWHIEENMELTGGILRWLARKRLTDIMKEDLESILCDSLVEVLDTKIRKTLAGLNLVMPINGAIFMSYLLVGQPLLLPYGAVRTYHQGITSTNHHGAKFVPFQIGSNHHVIYHIHESLLSETVQSVCNRGYMDGNITVNHERVHVACQTAEMSVKNMEASNTANIMLNILLTFQNGIERMLSKNYTVSILHSSNLAVLFRLKSEIVKINEHSYEYDDQIFTIMSEVLRAHVRLPLPVPAGAQIDRPMIKLLPDRIIFATDFVFKGG